MLYFVNAIAMARVKSDMQCHSHCIGVRDFGIWKNWREEEGKRCYDDDDGRGYVF